MLELLGRLFSPGKDKEMPEKSVINFDESTMMPKDLFVRDDGSQMIFVMSANGECRQQIKNYIEAGGGILLSKAPFKYRDNSIRLVTENEIVINRELDLFDYNYILDCVKAKNIVTNVNDYRVNKTSVFKPYDALDVMRGRVKWTELEKVDIVGEKVSDIEEDEDSYEPSTKPRLKPNRMPYCKNEDQEIVDWIVKHQAYKVIKGRQIWEKMEAEGVARGRSNQSMKEHFRKFIFSQIHTFKLSEEIIQYFKVAMGELEDDLIGTKVSLMWDEAKKNVLERDSSPTKKVSSPKALSPVKEVPVPPVRSASPEKNAASPAKRVPHSPVIFSPVKSSSSQTSANLLENEDEQEECYKCSAEDVAPGIKKIESQHRKVCFDCSRPSTSRIPLLPFISPSVSGSSKPIKRLIDNSDIEDNDDKSDIDDNSSFATEQLDDTEDPSEPIKRKRKVRLFSDKFMDTPAVPTPAVTARKKTTASAVQQLEKFRRKRIRAGNIEDAPMSSQAFRKGLKEFNDQGSSSSTEGEDIDYGTTSTQLPIIDNEEEDVFQDNSPPRKSPRRELGSGGVSKNVKVNLKKLSKEDIAEHTKAKVTLTDDEKTTKHTRSIITDKSAEPSVSRNLFQDDFDNFERIDSTEGRRRILDQYLESQVQQVESAEILQVEDDPDNGIDDVKKVEVVTAPLSSVGSDEDLGAFKSPSPVRKPMKRKIASGGKILNDSNWGETSSIKSGRFYNEGHFAQNFRAPYTPKEDLAILNFFLYEGGYQFRKGIRVWKVMESRNVCPGRSSQSMKEYWKKLSSKMDKYDVTVEQLVKADKRVYGTSTDEGVDADEDDDDQRSVRGWKPNQKMYTKEEDLKIIKYLLENKRYGDVKGNSMWEMLAARNIVDGRSWHSLKERFRKPIRKKLESNPNAYDLSQREIQCLLSEFR